MNIRKEMNEKGLSIVLGSYNRKNSLKQTIKSIRKSLGDFPKEIIVIDGGSKDGSLGWLSKQKDIVTIIQQNNGNWKGEPVKRRSWGYFMNLGFKVVQGKYVCMVSDDCYLHPDALLNGYNLLEKSTDRVGGCAFYFRDYPEESAYKIGKTIGNTININHGIFKKDVLEMVGYANEDDFKFYFADGDLSLKIADSGYKIIPSENSYIEHCMHINFFNRKKNVSKLDDEWSRFIVKWKHKMRNKNDIGEWNTKEYHSNVNYGKRIFHSVSFSDRLLYHLYKLYKKIKYQGKK